jgi:hypothetical protein
MAGRLLVSTLNNDTGVLATQNGMTGIAKAWANWNGSGGISIRASFNVSSITRNSGGNYTVNFTVAMPNANYCIAGSTDYEGVTVNQAINLQNNDNGTTYSQILTTAYDGSLIDNSNINVVFFSS